MNNEEKDLSTEEKIKEAARQIFQQKGFAGTRTRDIAEAAGINLALLNYYYRSKEKLFSIVMEESLKELFQQVQQIVRDENTTLAEKIDIIINLYVDILIENPNLPLFILSEIQANPQLFQQKIGLSLPFLSNLVIIKQTEQQLKQAGLENINPFHFLLNAVSMIVFPFIAKPLIKSVAGTDEATFRQFVDERRVLVSMWVKNMLQIQ